MTVFTFMPMTGSPKLNDREFKILELIAQGKSNPEIASLMFLSPSTVKTFVSQLFSRLCVDDRMSAVLRAIQLGILPCPCPTHVRGVAGDPIS